MTEDGVAIVQFGLGWGASIDGVEFRYNAAVAFDAGGRALWARQDVVTIAAAGGDAWVETDPPPYDAPSIAVVRAADGLALREIPMPEGATEISASACEHCGTRRFASFGWRDGIDLGALGTRSSATGGVTLLASGDAGPVWEVTLPVPPSDAPDVLTPSLPRAPLPDGSTVAVWHHPRHEGPDDMFCPVSGACVPPGGAVIVSYSPSGEQRWVRATPWTVGDPVMVSDGSVVFPWNGVLTRLGTDGTTMWEVPIPHMPQAIAVDERSGVVWATADIPIEGFSTTIGDATVRDCGMRAPVGGSWNETTLLVRFDLGTGALLDVRLPAEGLSVNGLAVLPDGGVVLTGSTHIAGDPESSLRTVELCGVSIASEDGAPAEVIIAAIE